MELKEFIAYNESIESGLVARYESKGYDFQLQYRPQEIMALQGQTDKSSLGFEFLEKITELREYQFFHFRISSIAGTNFLKAQLKSNEEYYQRIAYFTSYAQPDFKLVQGGDTLECKMYHFERNYGISPYHTIILGFDNPRLMQNLDRVLVYNDRILGSGSVKLAVKATSINNIPKLKF